MERRTFIRASLAAVAGSAAGATAWAAAVEPRLLEVTRHGVATASPAPGPPAVLVHLPDLHFGGLHDLHRRIAARVVEADPDLVLLPGDSAEAPDGLDALARFLDLLPAVPAVAVPGNWERWGDVPLPRLAALLEGTGGGLLVNERAEMDLAGRPLTLTGVDDLVTGDPDFVGAVGGAPPRGLHVLLCHCPAYRDALEGAPPDLVLAGHTHGGQVDVLGLRYTPAGSGRYVEGWYRDGGPPMYVSRGVGTSVVPLRLGARPELAILRIGDGIAATGRRAPGAPIREGVGP